MAVLDRDGVYGAPRLHMAARKAGVKALVGAELTIRTQQQPYSPQQSDVPADESDFGPVPTGGGAEDDIPF